MFLHRCAKRKATINFKPIKILSRSVVCAPLIWRRKHCSCLVFRRHLPTTDGGLARRQSDSIFRLFPPPRLLKGSINVNVSRLCETFLSSSWEMFASSSYAAWKVLPNHRPLFRWTAWSRDATSELGSSLKKTFAQISVSETSNFISVHMKSVNYSDV